MLLLLEQNMLLAPTPPIPSGFVPGGSRRRTSAYLYDPATDRRIQLGDEPDEWVTLLATLWAAGELDDEDFYALNNRWPTS